MEINFQEGWRQWYSPEATIYPPSRGIVEIIRQEWDSPRKVEVQSLPPEMNIIGLYWRPIRR